MPVVAQKVPNHFAAQPSVIRSHSCSFSCISNFPMHLSVSRRQFIGTGFTALAAAGLPLSPQPVSAQSSGASRRNQSNPFVYRFEIGEIEAWSISDGHMLFKEGVGLMWPKEQRDAMAREL